MKPIVLIAALAIAGPAFAAPSPEQQVFFDRLKTLCGQSFPGKVVSTDAPDADFIGNPLIMRVGSCTADEVRVPFAVGEDRSRTWVITRTEAGLRLKHDHRHTDGTEDVLPQYGGEAATPGTAGRQEFPVDAFPRPCSSARSARSP